VDSTARQLPWDSETAITGDAWNLQPSHTLGESKIINELQ